MINKSKMEAEAIEYAGKKVGLYIEECMSGGVGSDLAQWPPQIYCVFIDKVCSAFVERMQELSFAEGDHNDPPF